MTTYRVFQEGVERDDRGGETLTRPKLVALGEHEAHGPEAACLAAAEIHSDRIGPDFGYDLVAVPARNVHKVTLAPKRGFELAPPEDSLLSTPEGEPEGSGMGAAE